jgi:hypothetical protein
MTPQEFLDGMARLQSRKKWAGSLDDSFAAILGPKIRQYSWDTFQKVIEDFLGAHHLPTVHDIAMACANKSRSTGDFSGRRITLSHCDWCDHAGIVLMAHTVTGAVAPFCCTKCRNGGVQRELSMSFSQGPLATSRDGLKLGFMPESKSMRQRYEQVIADTKSRNSRLPYADQELNHGT